MRRRLAIQLAAAGTAVTVACCATPAPAAAFDLTKPICSLTGLVSTLAGKVCSAARHPGRVLEAGKKLLGGHLGGAVETLSGAGTAVKALTAGAVVAAIAGWVLGGARTVLRATAHVIAATTRPQLESTWFSASYWRMAAISALLTLPFLFAAAIQALLRSDLGLLVRSAFGYLPLGLLAVSLAAPVTMLLLTASDELSSLITAATGGGPSAALAKFGALSVGLSGASGSTFLAFFIGLLTVAATVTLWIELLIRSAAVYVVVLMLPLFFAALVWPARRVWAVRAVELLIALILSKFAIVAVLSLGGAALGHTTVPSATQTLAGTTLVLLAAFTPWGLLRLLPLHELATGVDGLRASARPVTAGLAPAQDTSEIAEEMIRQLPSDSLPGAGGLGRTERPGPEPGPAPSTLDGLTTDPEDANGSPALEQPPGEPASGEATGEPTAPESGERIAGMEARWQQPDGSWPTLVLGPDSLPEPASSAPSGSSEADPPEPTPDAPEPPETEPPPPPTDPDAGLL